MEDISTASTLTSISAISICTYLGIDTMMLGLYVTLLCMDFFTGFLKGIMYRNFQSSIAINGVAKKLILILLIFSIGITGKIVGFEDLTSLMSAAFAALGVAEFYSILSNIYEIKTGKKTKEFDGVSFLISGIMEYIEKKIRKIDKDINNPKEDEGNK